MRTKGRIQFSCSSEELNRGFSWAKEQALFYVHEEDLVGYWYEAALPKRQSFCVRDVAHHSMGAHALGLEKYTKNMLLKFVQNIAASRKFCTFWEIDKDDRPCPVDYSNDNDFWYNLPANFDLMDTCFRMYQVTGDRDYLEHLDFLHFYDWTIHNYVEEWDDNKDGILERKQGFGRLGIPSYCEDSSYDGVETLIDMLVIEIRGYLSASELYEQGGNTSMQQLCKERSSKLLKVFDDSWWDPVKEQYYQYRDSRGELKHSSSIGHALSLCYYDLVRQEERRQRHMERLDREADAGRANVESLSHYPMLFYRCHRPDIAYKWLKELIDPKLHRREYPEVSYSVIESYIFGLAGIKVYASQKELFIAPEMPKDVQWFKISNLPYLDGEVDVICQNNSVAVTNRTKQMIKVNGKRMDGGCCLEIPLEERK